MGIHLCLLLFLQIVCYSSIEAYSGITKITMLSKIINDPRQSDNNYIMPIWLQESSRSCNIEKPSEKRLTDPTFLQFGFVQYLCVILYDASLRYLNVSQEIKFSERNSDIVKNIIEGSSPVTTFCQRMKENNWNTTIEENKRWVSNFNDNMKNGSCQRYCVSDAVLNPLCAFALWIDSAVKQAEHSLPVAAQESLLVHASSDVKSKVNADSTGKQILSEAIGPKVQKHDPKIEGKRQHDGTMIGRQESNVQLTVQQNDIQLAGSNLVHPPIAELNSNVADAQEHPPGSMEPSPQPVGGTRESGHSGNNPGYVDPTKVDRPLSSPIDGLPPALENNDSMKKTTVPDEISGDVHGNILELQVDQPVHVETKPKTKLANILSQKVIKSEIYGRTEKLPLQSEGSDTTALDSTSTKVGDSAQGAFTGPNAEKPHSDQQNGNTVGVTSQVLVTTKNGSVGGSMPANGGQDTPPKNQQVPSADSPLVPEPPKETKPSEDKAEKEEMNTTVPVTKVEEEPGSNKAETTAQIRKSKTEDGNPANEGDTADDAQGEEPNTHEGQKNMDDLETISQVDEGDPNHGDIPAQDPEVDSLDQQDETRFSVIDHEDTPAKADTSSTKLSDYESDEMGGSWLQGQPERGPQNDAEGGYAHDRFVDAEDSHFFAYFMTMIILCIIGYLIFHNKQKILALALEGRVRKGSRRRPSTSGYRKLDSNLEEAVTSNCTGSSVTHVIY